MFGLYSEDFLTVETSLSDTVRKFQPCAGVEPAPMRRAQALGPTSNDGRGPTCQMLTARQLLTGIHSASERARDRSYLHAAAA